MNTMNQEEPSQEMPPEQPPQETSPTATEDPTEKAAGSPQPEPEPAEKDPLAECEQRAGEYLAGWRRAMADYQNLQKETARRLEEISKFATEGLLLELLPMVDHFKYAFKGVPDAERTSQWLKGIEHIQTNFLKILEEHGLQMINTVGAPFDPHLHEALEEVNVPEGVSGTVAEEVATGFILNGKVIQHAKVKVIK